MMQLLLRNKNTAASDRRAAIVSLPAGVSAWLSLIVSLCVCCLSGCGGTVFSPTYADTSYPQKNMINGLGAFERICKRSDVRFFDVTRLSPRLDQADCILLVGDTFHPPAKEARDWLEEWLRSKPGRTIIYFGRDFEADIFYRQQTLDQVDASSLYRGQLELADLQSQLDSLMSGEITRDAFCRWFVLKWDVEPRVVKEFRGPWSDQLPVTDSGWPVRVHLERPVKERAPSRLSTAAIVTTTPTPTRNPNVVKRNRGLRRATIARSFWNETDIEAPEVWDAEWRLAPQSQNLLEAADGTPLVMRLTSANYPGSQIITLANAAPLMNGSLVESHFRMIATRLVEQIGSGKRLAVLPYDSSGIMISSVEESENNVAGLSVLTTWPMNIIMVHLTLFGIVMCLALFPILGRPRSEGPRTTRDFGMHAQALGQMLSRTRDMTFALRVIAEYTRIVRGESLPAWLQSSSTIHDAVPVPPENARGMPNTNASTPNASAPNASAPNASTPNTSTPNTSTPNTSTPNTSTPNTSTPNTSTPNTPGSTSVSNATPSNTSGRTGQ